MKQYVSNSIMHNDERLTCNFSYEAIDFLYEYYNQLEDELGIEIDYDPIAIRCDWCEYDSYVELLDNYNENDLYEMCILEVEMLQGENHYLVLQ